MKSILFDVAMLAVLPGQAVQDPGYYYTPEEARLHMPEPRPDCLDDAGRNNCTASLLAVDGAEGLGWMPFWAPTDAEFACVDRATADFRVDCEAPDAVRSVRPPGLCVRNPDGSRGPCHRRELPYRYTPKS